MVSLIFSKWIKTCTDARFIVCIMIEGIESEVIMSKRLEDENLERQAQILAQQILVRRGTKGNKRAERVALDVARKQVSLQK